MNTQEFNRNTRNSSSEDQPNQELPMSKPANLGEVRSVHKFSVAGLWGVWGTIAVLLALITGPLLWYGAVIIIMDEGIVGILNFAGCVMTIGGLVLFSIGVLTISNIFKSRKDKLTIYEKGFELCKGGRTKVWRWEEIKEIEHLASAQYSRYGTRYSFTAHEFIFRGAAGKSTKINQETRNVLKAVRMIQDEVNKLRVPEIIDQFGQGHTTRIGPFGISASELSHGGKSIPWSEIEVVQEETLKKGVFKVDTEIGKIIVRKKDQDKNWAEVMVADIPNDRLFVEVANHFIKANRASMEGQSDHKDVPKSMDRQVANFWGIFACVVAWATGTLIGSFMMVDPGQNLADVIYLFARSARENYSFRCCNLPILILAVGSWLFYSRKAWKKRVRYKVVLGIIATLSFIGGLVSGWVVIVELSM